MTGCRSEWTLVNDLSADDDSMIVFFQVVSSCTQTEWCEIWDSLLVLNNNIILNIIHTAVFLLTVAEKPNRTDKSAACMFNCYKNFVHVTRVSIIFNIAVLILNIPKMRYK